MPPLLQLSHSSRTSLQDFASGGEDEEGGGGGLCEQPASKASATSSETYERIISSRGQAARRRAAKKRAPTLMPRDGKSSADFMRPSPPPAGPGGRAPLRYGVAGRILMV